MLFELIHQILGFSGFRSGWKLEICNIWIRSAKSTKSSFSWSQPGYKENLSGASSTGSHFSLWQCNFTGLTNLFGSRLKCHDFCCRLTDGSIQTTAVATTSSVSATFSWDEAKMFLSFFPCLEASGPARHHSCPLLTLKVHFWGTPLLCIYHGYYSELI